MLIRGISSSARLPPLAACRVSVITAAELEVGVRRSSRPAEHRRAVAAFLALFTVVPLETSVVSHYGEIRVDLEKKGTPIGPLDLLIAAHARSLGSTLITANVCEFRRVRALKVLAWKR